jgi:hypothetical protein
MQRSQSDISEIKWDDLKFNAFTEDELDLLKLFHEQATQITDTYFMKNCTFKSTSVIQVDRIKGELNTSLEGPDEANIRSMVLLVRPITLTRTDKTKIRIDIIIDILINRSANDTTRSYLQIILSNYKDRSSEPQITLRGRYGLYTESDIVNLWVNGYYFHKDSSKRKELDDLMEWPQMKPVVKSILLNWIIDSCNWAWSIDTVLMNTILRDLPH